MKTKLLILTILFYLGAACAPTPTATPSPAPTAAMPTPTPLVEPTAPIPTLQPTSTTIPTPEATPTPTQAALGIGRQVDGTYIVTTEKGEKLVVPAIPGLRQEVLQEIDGQKPVVYRAEKGNPYGLKEDVFAGLFYPKVYLVTEKVEDAVITGAVGLRADVIRIELQKAGSPAKNVLLPLPFDPTSAKNPNAAIFLQNSKNTITGSPKLFVGIPVGSWLVNPTESASNQPATVSIAKQYWGTVVACGYPADLLGQYALNVNIPDFVTSNDTRVDLGDPITEVDKPNLPSVYETLPRQPRPVQAVNVEMYGQGYFEDKDGKTSTLGITTNNIMRKGTAFIFPIGNNNPLLNK